MTKDMTEGSSLKLIVTFFVPLLLGNLFQQFYNLMDTIIVGKGINDQALAAVGSTGSVNFLIFGFVIGLANGISILMAQAFGAKDYERLRRVVAMSVVLCLISSVVITAVSFLGISALMKALQTPEDIYADAVLYIRIIFAGIIVTVFNNLAVSLLRALGDGKTPLLSMVFASVINIVLDLYFILSLKWGVAGAAYATVLSQVVSTLICFYKISRLEILKFHKEDWRMNYHLFKQLFSIGLPVAFMNSVTAVGCMILQYFVNSLGTAYTAAYSASSKIVNIFGQPGTNLGFAMATFAGQNLGARRLDRIKDGMKKTLWISVLMNGILGLILILFPEQLASTMLSDPDIIVLSRKYIPISGIFLWILGFLFVYRSTLQGMGKTVVPMISGGVELGMRVICVIATVRIIGFSGIAVAEVMAWVGAELMLMLYYYHVIKKLEQTIPLPVCGKTVDLLERKAVG